MAPSLVEYSDSLKHTTSDQNVIPYYKWKAFKWEKLASLVNRKLPIFTHQLIIYYSTLATHTAHLVHIT